MGISDLDPDAHGRRPWNAGNIRPVITQQESACHKQCNPKANGLHCGH
jgi:hypothetical protein